MRRSILAAAAASISTALIAAPSAAPAFSDVARGGSGNHAAGWKRYHATSFTTAAGDLCPFRLHSQVLFDREFVRTTARFRDGTPKVQQYVGPLVVRLVNKQTDRSVVRDLSGRAVLRYQHNGAYDFASRGPVAVGFHPGDSLSPGYYVLRGSHVVHFGVDGHRRITRDHGAENNVCDALG